VRVLTVNCGSSSLKFDVVEIQPGTERGRTQAQGSIERIGATPEARLAVAADERRADVSAPDIPAAFDVAISLLEERGLLAGIEAIGHRVVHGGSRFSRPARIDEEVLRAIEGAAALAPLHNGPALSAVRAARVRFGDSVPMVASFDTGFYAGLPDVASCYALPRELSRRLGIRRYGFHGLAHRYMVERYRQLRPEVEHPRLITLQLGNGCSATASLDGRPLDTSMGFTPLEGLIMGTRSGDLDPAIPLYLASQDGMSPGEVEALLNTESGLRGLSGGKSDMRELIAAARSGDAAADLAVRAFAYRAVKYIGAYLAVLRSADAIVFGGGIGEHSPEVREAICGRLGWAGLQLNAAVNGATSGEDRRISTDASTLECWVVHVDEAAIIAADVAECLGEQTIS
jgi:acetate kinase